MHLQCALQIFPEYRLLAKVQRWGLSALGLKKMKKTNKQTNRKRKIKD